MKVCKLLHHDANIHQVNGITIVTGETSNGDKTLIVWDSYSPTKQTVRGPLDKFTDSLTPRQRKVFSPNNQRGDAVVLPRSNTPGVEGKTFSFIEKKERKSKTASKSKFEPL